MPTQPEFPQPLHAPVRGLLDTMASAPPWASYHYPGMPGTGPQSHQSPQSMFTDYEIMRMTSGHPSMGYGGNAGFAGTPMFPFTDRGGLPGMAINWAANAAMGAFAGSPVGLGMVPLGGMGGVSRMEWLMDRQRQEISSMILSGDGNLPSILSRNPNLGYGLPSGIAMSPLFQRGLGVLDGYQTAFLTAHGRMGTVFGGDLLSQGIGAANFMSALSGGMSNPGGTGWDRTAMQGLGADDLVRAIASARSMGLLGVTGSSLRAISDRAGSMEFGPPDSRGAARAARELGMGVADVLAAGRDVLGQGVSAADVMSAGKELFGNEGMGDPGTAARRFREIEAAGQVLDMDQKTVAAYMRLMKRVGETAGLIGESGTLSAMASIQSIEATARFGDASGVQVDKGVVASRMNRQFDRSALSGDAREKTVLANVLAEQSRDILMSSTLEVNGSRMSAAEVSDRIQDGLGRMERGEMTAEERQGFERFMRDAGAAMASSSDPRLRKMANDIVDRTTHYDGGREELSAQLGGRTSYNAASRSSGVTHGALNAVEESMRRTQERLNRGDGADVAAIREMGGLRGAMRVFSEAGVFTALESGGAPAALKRLESIAAQEADRRGLTGQAREDFIRRRAREMGVAVQSLVGDAIRYRGETYEDAAGALAGYEMAQAGGRHVADVRGAIDEAVASREIMSRMAGGDIKERSLKGILMDIARGGLKNSGQGLSVPGLVSAAIKDGLGTERLEAMAKVLSGEEGFTDENGNRRDLAWLQARLRMDREIAGSSAETQQQIVDEFHASMMKALGLGDEELSALDKALSGATGDSAATGAAGEREVEASNPVLDKLDELIETVQESILQVVAALALPKAES